MIGFINGKVTDILAHGFVMEYEWGTTVRVSTQVRGQQTGLRVGDTVRVSGGFDAEGIYLSAWASKTGTGGQAPWWRFWRRR